MTAAISTRSVDRTIDKVGTPAKALTAYLLVVSGAAFPLRFIPINYEWIALAATTAFLIYLMTQHSAGILGRYPAFLVIVLFCVAMQVLKVAISSEPVELTQFFRGLYGLGVFYIGYVSFSAIDIDTDRIVHIANRVLLLLTFLVIISIITGFRFYATGFLPDAGDMDVQDQVSTGNYRIITYYTSMITFLLFYNQSRFIKTGSVQMLAGIFCALVLIALTGTRSLIAPCLIVSVMMFVIYAKPGKTLALLIVIVVACVALYLFIPDIANAYVTRFMVGELFDSWRATEQALALNAINDNMLIGLPLGVPYTHVMSAMAGGVEGYALNADYDLHNEYLWFLLYFGIVGSLILLVLVILSIIVVYRANGRGTLTAAFVAYLAVMFVAMNYSAILLRGYGALWYGIIFALCARSFSTGMVPGRTDRSDRR